MTLDEMSKVFLSIYPSMNANPQRVGRFAKQIGYRHTKQMVNRKYEYFYLKETNINLNEETA